MQEQTKWEDDCKTVDLSPRQTRKRFIWTRRKTGGMRGGMLNRDSLGVAERNVVSHLHSVPPWGVKKRGVGCVFCGGKSDNKEMTVPVPWEPITEDSTRWWTS